MKKRRKTVSTVNRSAGVVRRFVAKTETGEARADGRIDTGADVTILSKETACSLGITSGRPMELEGLGGVITSGFAYPVTIRINHRTGNVEAVTDLFVEQADGSQSQSKQKRNLIGEDFLRDSKAKLDYGKPGMEFSGARLGPGQWRPASPKRAALVKKLMKNMCERPKRKRK